MKTMIGVLTFTAILCVGVLSTGVARAGLVQYWAFEETSGLTASNGVSGGNAGTLVNFAGTEWSTDTPAALAHSSGALDFEAGTGSGDWVNGGAIGLSSTSAGGGATVSMWIKPESLSNENRPFSQANRSGAEVAGATRLYSDGKLDVWGGSSPGTGYQTVAPASTIQTGTWQHVALTWSGNTVSAYVDGQFTGSATSNFDFDKQGATDLLFGIGAEYGASGDTFDGLVDDVAVFDQALDSYRIKSLSNGVAPSKVLNNVYVVNVDLQRSTDGVDYVGLGAAPDDANNTYWNVLEGPSGTSFTATDLIASDGITATPIDVSVSNVGGITTQPEPPNALQRDRVYTTSGVGDFEISGLEAGCSYDIYLFGAWHPTVSFATDYTIGGVTKTASGITHDAGYPWIEGDDYVVFKGLTGLTSILGTFQKGAGASYGVLTGIQIYQVPEPSTAVLLGIGVVGLAGFGRRRRRVSGPNLR